MDAGAPGIRPSFRGCLQGCALALVAYVLYVGFAVVVGGSWPEVARALAATRLLGGGLSWTTVIVASVINPFYEEIFVCGYVISVLAEPRAGAAQAVGLATAVNVSALIRLSYHLYQGVAGVLAVVPLGLLFALWFARTRQLWPLIVAHAILDFVALARGVG
jgi:membrane protease YdiL (CAAX protease family)